MTGRLARWQLNVRELEFNIVHRVEVKQHAADALSRLLTCGTKTTKLQVELPATVIESCEKTDETSPFVIILVVYTITAAQSTTTADSSDAKLPTVVEHMTSRYADKIC